MLRYFYEINPWQHIGRISNSRGLHYKTFYDRNLRVFIISQSVCLWQAFPALVFVGEERSLPQSRAFERYFTRVGSGLQYSFIVNFYSIVVQYSFIVQQYCTVLQYSSILQFYSIIVLYSFIVQQYSTVLQYSSIVQFYSIVVQYNFIVQYQSAVLQ